MTNWPANVTRIIVALMVLLAVSSISAEPPSDPYFAPSTGAARTPSWQWGLEKIGLTDPADTDSGWRTETGENHPVIVAVIDTGLDFHHPDINPDNIWRNPGEQANGVDDDGNGYVDDLIGWNFEENNNNPWDLAGHGTHVAGIIGAASNNSLGIAGINWGVKIMPLKVLGFTGRGGTINISEAIFYAVTNGASIINLSLGGERIARVEQEAIDYAVKKGVVVVAAAGNSGISTADYGIAASEQVITVASVGMEGQRSAFSNWGPDVDIAAPGEDIVSLRARRTDFALVAGQQDYQAGAAFVGDANQLYLATGTSFAAPFVSGVASLILANQPDLSGADVKRMIINTATDIDVPGIDQYSGYGLLNAAAALKSDPRFFISAHISNVSVVNVDGKPKIRVFGTADADRLKSAWIEVGAGENPENFRKVSKNISRQVLQGPIDDLEVSHFRGEKTWTLRLVCKHANGQTRESRFVLNLG